MANDRDDPPIYIDPIRLSAGRILASDEQEGGSHAAIRPIHRLANGALADAAAGAEVSASWRPGVFYYVDPDPGGGGSTPDSGPVIQWLAHLPTDRHSQIRVMIRGVQGPLGVNGRIYVQAFNGLVVIDEVEWIPPTAAAPLLVERPERSPVLMLDVAEDPEALFIRVGVESDGDEVHVRAIVAEWPALDDADLDGSVAIDGQWPFGVDDSIDPGRPLPACRGRQATGLAESIGARGHTALNYAALDEPIPTATGGAADFSSPPLGLVHASLARPYGGERTARYGVLAQNFDASDPANLAGTITLDGPHYARPLGDDPDQTAAGTVGEGERLLTMGGMPIGLLRLEVEADDDPEDFTVTSVRVGEQLS